MAPPSLSFMKNLFLRVLAVLGTLLFAANTKAQRINFPIVVPLHFTQITGGDYKLGIYLSIGTGAAPALFELDTGATGFFADLQPEHWRVALVGKRRHFLKHAGRCLLCQRLALYRNYRRSHYHPVCLERSLFGPAHDTGPEGGADGLHRRRENQ